MSSNFEAVPNQDAFTMQLEKLNQDYVQSRLVFLASILKKSFEGIETDFYTGIYDNVPLNAISLDI